MPLRCLPLNSGHWDKFSNFCEWVDLPERYKPKGRDEREREWKGPRESLEYQTLIRAWNGSLKCDWQLDILELPWWQRTRLRQILLSNHSRGCLIKVTDFCKILKEGCDSFKNLASEFESRRWHEQENILLFDSLVLDQFLNFKHPSWDSGKKTSILSGWGSPDCVRLLWCDPQNLHMPRECVCNSSKSHAVGPWLRVRAD